MLSVPVSDAKARLTDLVRRAEAGEEVVLTRHGVAAVRLTPVTPELERADRRRVLDEIRAMVRSAPPSPGPSAARSQDFLYDEDGLPA